MKKIDIVVIGAGLYVCGKGTDGFGTILPAIFEWKRLNNNVGAIHCASTSSESSKKLLQKAKELEVKTGIKLQIKSYPSSGSKNHTAYQEALNNCKNPACAIIAVPDHLHYKIAKDCLEAGVHTLLVKPLTPTYVEGLDLVNLAKKNNLYGAVEFHKRWDKSNIMLRDKFQAGDLGAPLNCWVEYSQRRSVPLSFFKDWASQTSILQYLGIHYIDIIRFVTSASPKRVMAIGQKAEIINHGINTYDSIQCIIEWEMPNGTPFTETILTSWVDPENSSAISDQKIKFVGTRGRYEADQKERGIRINTDKMGVQHINPDFCMAYGFSDGNIHWSGYGIESITTFINDVVALESGLKTLSELQTERPSFKESLISTMVTEAAHHSINNGSTWQIIAKLKK
jgi:predicted dehydrogenase